MRQSAAVAIALLALGASLGAQDPVPPLPATPAPAEQQPPKVFRSSASLVALNVTVTDGARHVTGLTQDDFEVYEDGVRQHVRFFESAAVPMDVILLLDTSSSMRSRMTTVHEAARGFMKMLRPGDRGAVISFDDDVQVLQALTFDSAAIASAIGSTVANGSTALHNAIYIALKTFGRSAQVDDVRRQAIAVLSDGEDTSSLVSAEDVVALARKTGVSVYTIGLQSEFASLRKSSGRKYFSESEYALKTLATETGAQAFFPSTVHDLKNVYQAIADELETQYSIGYAPTNSRPDGRYRRIVVRITSNPAFRPRARAGYTAESVRTVAAARPLPGRTP